MRTSSKRQSTDLTAVFLEKLKLRNFFKCCDVARKIPISETYPVTDTVNSECEDYKKN